MGTILLVVILLAIAAAIFLYNAIIALQNQVQNAWRQIDVQLKRRHDLVPNLVETVRGAMEHERETLTRVIEARAQAVNAVGVRERADAENTLTQALRGLWGVMEAYPTLRANENALRLQEELTTTENQIAFARQFYNDSVMQFNQRQQTFPGNVIAGFFKFSLAEYFKADDSERAVPKVDLSFGR